MIDGKAFYFRHIFTSSSTETAREARDTFLFIAFGLSCHHLILKPDEGKIVFAEVFPELDTSSAEGCYKSRIRSRNSFISPIILLS